MSGQRGSTSVYLLVLALGAVAAGTWFWQSIPQQTAAAAAMQLWGPLPSGGGSVPTVAAAERSTSPQVRSLTQPDGMDGFPDWSPDGKAIAFMREGDIWSMSAGGSGLRRITDQSASWDVAPAWAPDGSRIAFVRYPDDPDPDAQAFLMAVRSDGSKLQELTREPDLIGYVAWSPDGNRLVYSTREHLVILDLQSGAKQVVFAAPDSADLLPGGVTWSRDGRYLVFGASFHVGTPRQHDLHRLPLDGGTAAIRVLTTHGGIMPSISPDGRRLAYREPRGRSGLHILDLSTGQDQIKVADSGPYRFFHPKWAPDGKSIIASRLVMPGERESKLISAIVLIPSP